MRMNLDAAGYIADTFEVTKIMFMYKLSTQLTRMWSMSG